MFNNYKMWFNLKKTNYQKLCNNNNRIFQQISSIKHLKADSTIRNIKLKYDNTTVTIQIAGCRSNVLFKYGYNGNMTNVVLNKKEIKKINNSSDEQIEWILHQKIYHIICTQITNQLKEYDPFTPTVSELQQEIAEHKIRHQHLLEYQNSLIYSFRGLAIQNMELKNQNRECENFINTQNQTIANLRNEKLEKDDQKERLNIQNQIIANLMKRNEKLEKVNHKKFLKMLETELTTK